MTTEPYYDSEHEVIEKNVPGGLLDLPFDGNDYALGSIFKQPDLSTLPESFWYSPQHIKSQGDSDLCSGYAVTSAIELHEDVELSPEYQFARTRQLTNAPVDIFGANLRTACSSAVKFGAKESKYMPWTLEKNGRDFFAEFSNIPAEADNEAFEHRQKTYFAVKDVGYDLFDDIRLAIHSNRAEECAVVTGAKWRPEWLSSKDGIILPDYGDWGTGHAFVILGYQWKPSAVSLKYEHYLVLQLSSGEKVGNRGLFYMDRMTANKELHYGNFLFRDINPTYARFLSETGEKYSPSLLGKLSSYYRALFA